MEIGDIAVCYRAMHVVPSLQLGTGKTAAVRLGGWLSRVRCLSVRAIAAEHGRRAVGEARQRRVYNTKEVYYTC